MSKSITLVLTLGLVAFVAGCAHQEEPIVIEPITEEPEEIPFYRKVIAQTQGEDPNGYGPNWSNVDDFDIPTVLRKQMD